MCQRKTSIAKTETDCRECGRRINPGDPIELAKSTRWAKSYGRWGERAIRYWKHADCMIHQRCPACNGRIIAGNYAWGCENWSSGCAIRVPFSSANPVQALWMIELPG
jgi:hypothetical protein